MYCTSCGKQIDNFKYCPFCGNETENIIGSKPLIDPDKLTFNELTFNSSSSKMAGAIVVIILCIIMQALFIFMIFSQSRTIILYTVLFVPFIIIFFVLILLNIIKASKISKTFLCLNNDGLYGMGGSSVGYFVIHNFNCRYQDILNVSTEKGFLIINTVRGNYRFAIDNYDQAANEIYERMRAVKGTY